MMAGDPAAGSIPLYREELAVDRRTVEVGRLRVSTIVEEREELVEQLLKSAGYEIERVAIDRRVESAPAVREEGDTIILPVLEERLVVEKHLILREEIHLRRVVKEERHQEAVVLRSEEVAVRRTAAGDSLGGCASDAADEALPPSRSYPHEGTKP